MVCRQSPDCIRFWITIEFIPGSLNALRTLATLSIPVMVVSNHSHIGRRLVKREAVDNINHMMMDHVHAQGGRVGDVHVCAGHPDEGCSRRKSGADLPLIRAAVFSIYVPGIWIMGDSFTDTPVKQKADRELFPREQTWGKYYPRSLYNCNIPVDRREHWSVI